eukprot:TRINITY_DN2127_c1_g1_i2.p1 TRINITY_DN2127_c1_g1~~TRINITY_DN2127_c1_g1_i2.p1  ORF type:complete len:350 (+),score=84.02 TRINITY_DN2127_c1_g1_i2:67-1116(+)
MSRLLPWLFLIVGTAILGILRTKLGDSQRGENQRLETELSLWKHTARNYLSGNEAALKQIGDGVISPLHKGFVDDLINVLKSKAESSQEDSDDDNNSNGNTDQELITDSSEDDEEWPPPAIDNKNIGFEITYGDVNNLPQWEKYQDIKDYYMNLVPSKGLKAQLQKVIKKVWKNWDTKSIWASYPSEDISDCATLTPECLFWSSPLMNHTVESFPEATNTNKVYRKCCIEHRKMREVTKNTFKVLYEAGIDMYVGDGTLLGSRRGHGTVIPWDTDIDVFSRIEDKDRIMKALKAASDSGDLPHAYEKDKHGRKMIWVYYAKKRITGDSHLEIWLTDGKQKRNNTLSYIR